MTAGNMVWYEVAVHWSGSTLTPKFGHLFSVITSDGELEHRALVSLKLGSMCRRATGDVNGTVLKEAFCYKRLVFLTCSLFSFLCFYCPSRLPDLVWFTSLLLAFWLFYILPSCRCPGPFVSTESFRLHFLDRDFKPRLFIVTFICR